MVKTSTEYCWSLGWITWATSNLFDSITSFDDFTVAIYWSFLGLGLGFDLYGYAYTVLKLRHRLWNPRLIRFFLALWFISDVFLMKYASKTIFSNESVFQLSNAYQLFLGWIISELLFLPVLFTSIFNPYIIWRSRKYRLIAETKAVPITKKWWHQRFLYHFCTIAVPVR